MTGRGDAAVPTRSVARKGEAGGPDGPLQIVPRDTRIGGSHQMIMTTSKGFDALRACLGGMVDFGTGCCVTGPGRANIDRFDEHHAQDVVRIRD
jgi:hypothetical protein